MGREITWYGGGFEEREPHAEVQFWVTNDGAIPYNGEPDSKHRIIQTALESPSAMISNIVTSARADVSSMVRLFAWMRFLNAMII